MIAVIAAPAGAGVRTYKGETGPDFYRYPLKFKVASGKVKNVETTVPAFCYGLFTTFAFAPDRSARLHGGDFKLKSGPPGYDKDNYILMKGHVGRQSAKGVFKVHIPDGGCAATETPWTAKRKQ